MATLNLNTCTFQQSRATIDRVHMLFHFIAIVTLLYHRTSHLLHGDIPVLAWGLITTSEIILSLIWLLAQAFRWRCVTRSVHPEKLPGDVELPGVDVFICTADPKKEPTVEVMSTVLSAMALDYPSEKLAVYLSDDGGSSLTLNAARAACLFARSWLPFCRKYGIKTRCPEAYFSPLGDDDRRLWSDEFRADEEHVKSTYQMVKKTVEIASDFGGIDGFDFVVNDRPSHVEVLHDNRKDGDNKDEQTKMPLLVYLSREKRPSHPHRFKAGALNALLRVSGIMSNNPYLLVLDCDMYCNDPTSARQAMCFHLDPRMSQSLAFVQYPQMFYNVSKTDIYDGQARSAYRTKYQGMDGLRGPVFAGTGYYLKKKALYGRPNQEDESLLEPEKNFGLSKIFIASLSGSEEQDTNGKGVLSDVILEEAKRLASCTFEKNTKWGKEIGYSYDSLLESTFTGYLLHCKGWESVYLYPKRPSFLGCTTIDMKDAVVQLMKWSSGLFQVGLSRFSPLTYGMSRMSILQSMCYGFFTFSPLYSVALLIYGTVPQLCLFSGIPLFPKVTNPWFGVFAVVYLSSLCQHFIEVLSTGGTVRTWWNEQRMWMIRLVTGSLFGCLDALMKWLGVAKSNFRLTNKAFDKENLEKYERGEFNFKEALMFMVPLSTLVILNIVCLIGGVKGVITERNLGEMFGQVFLSSSILVLSFPILEGLIPLKRKGK
ncbi:cellulose synthase-like protein G1 [Cornus florida]|uniref:cellulose synthase-like protein G1 n=1 Tax=Cornus florida TaxID=4283 RepID=UPI00289F3DD6|nr:cellulose synthase-like protein G1 [Cornus florida]